MRGHGSEGNAGMHGAPPADAAAAAAAAGAPFPALLRARPKSAILTESRRRPSARRRFSSCGHGHGVSETRGEWAQMRERGERGRGQRSAAQRSDDANAKQRREGSVFGLVSARLEVAVGDSSVVEVLEPLEDLRRRILRAIASAIALRFGFRSVGSSGGTNGRALARLAEDGAGVVLRVVPPIEFWRILAG